ncbi:MAG: hypothetical protein JO308_05975, partial [Verrucomicrobia bacterium]|nr:hypothetical protein [Verrucomicrobiota bacterium]
MATQFDFSEFGSRRVYIRGKIHPGLRVPLREIGQTPTRDRTGQEQPNPPLPVYDTSGPWGDPEHSGDVRDGLPALRRNWILARGDVENVPGRSATPN